MFNCAAGSPRGEIYFGKGVREGSGRDLRKGKGKCAVSIQSIVLLLI